ncbi:hypothetical protein N0V93_007748 [Gnomoniopsis smithogilvyi]|uniref:Inner centromere protein ARK-binding domain-containing protein n=1 Tax=Gnomoniopsis smithogilvyi TaxID=1191159 RepID=A0A9W8YKF5_9PEZI|nr:hypothetical protein N0V93_007748 [Gnomoniopsis smithogilvyi]
MATRPAKRPAVGAAAWCTEERTSALQITQSEIEEFAYSARNEMEWLNEHMAEVFSENQINVADIFKTPGKLRGKTPRTARKQNNPENRVPLSDIFSATPKGAPNPFTVSNPHHARTPTFRIAEDSANSPAKAAPTTQKSAPQTHASQASVVPADSGYYGSQSQDVMTDLDHVMEDVELVQSTSPQQEASEPRESSAPLAQPVPHDNLGLTTTPFEETLESAKEGQSKIVAAPSPVLENDDEQEDMPVVASSPIQLLGNESVASSPVQNPPPPSQTEQTETLPANQQVMVESVLEAEAVDDDGADMTHSPSDGSSPIRPLVRKSSLNFASLPAREPLTSNKSLGARMSRTSHIDQTRTSYFPRQTGSKSIGVRQDEVEDDEEGTDVAEDDMLEVAGRYDSAFAAHSKTYTQRLQDQITMLGKSQASGTRPSKSTHTLAGSQQTSFAMQSVTSQDAPATIEDKPRSPPRQQQVARTPGAFPEDDEDDWIAPPTTTKKMVISPSRPGIEKSYSTDIMEGLHGTETIGGVAFETCRNELEGVEPESPQCSPQKPPVSHPGRPVSGHGKSVSVPDMRNDIFGRAPEQDLVRKAVSVSNPVLGGDDGAKATEPLKSPTRSIRESPSKHNALKQVKNKFSSILKGSKGLLASSAALSAETKASIRNSPSGTKLHKQFNKSTESLAPETETQPLYPDLSKQLSIDSQPAPSSSSPLRSNGRKTRASTERDKRDQKQREKEEKEAQHLADQMQKLERAREVEREKARVFSREKQEKASAEVNAIAHKEQDKSTRTPAPKVAPVPTRTSPRKPQAQVDTEIRSRVGAETAGKEVAQEDVEMADAPVIKPPPSIPRLTATPGQTLKNREIKRPMKPTRDTAIKPKQAPTLIRVNTSSQHGGFHPSNNVLASSLHEALNNPQQSAKGKTIQPKQSVPSLNSSINSTTGRPKALELADRRRQEEEKKAQRKRELKAEMERKREEGRRQEEERKEKERQRAVAEEEAKKAAARQAAIERAKQTKAPPPAPRSQPSVTTGNSSMREKAPISRPPSRLGQSTMHRSQEEISRPVNAVLSTSSKTSTKRPLQHDGADDGVSRPGVGRSGPAQQKEAKRMRMSDEFDPEEEMEIQSYGTNIKGPPVRPSTGFKKDQSNKSLFGGGYAPAPQGVTRDIFKAPPVASHHSKSGHPLDMAQVSKAHIPFASSQHGGAASSHKTPARAAVTTIAKSAAKSAARSSPRFQNGENIELPEIQTDDEEEEDEDDEAKGLGVASWVDTPELRRELMRQETLDPLQVFGPPAPLKLEEVFKNKDRWNKFRARGSSANWGGTDRLTEEEIRKDMAAREKMRRDGGWSYELSKEMR